MDSNRKMSNIEKLEADLNKYHEEHDALRSISIDIKMSGDKATTEMINSKMKRQDSVNKIILDLNHDQDAVISEIVYNLRSITQCISEIDPADYKNTKILTNRYCQLSLIQQRVNNMMNQLFNIANK